MSGYVLSPKAVRSLTRALRGSASRTPPTFGPASISPDTFPPPFTVRWSEIAADSSPQVSGAWVIWLPDPSNLVIFGNAIPSVTGVTAAQGLPTGWYTVDNATESSNALYLVLTESASSTTVHVSASQGTATTGQTVTNVLIAKMQTDANTGAKAVRQFVDSTVTFGGSGDTVTPDDVSTQFVPPAAQGQPADPDEGKLQVKGWKAGAPESQTTLAADMSATGATGWLVFRNSNGGLEYKPLGQILAGGGDGDGTITFVAANDWYVNGSTHQLRMRLRVLDLATGQVTDKANTTYANGWEVICNTTPLSSIISS